MAEYSRLVNAFIDILWERPDPPRNNDVLASLIHQIPTCMTFRFAHNAAREAVAMILSVKCRKPKEDRNSGVYDITPTKPIHRGRRMVLTQHCVEFQKSEGEFDTWIKVKGLGGRGTPLLLPTCKTKHFHKWATQGKQASTIIITKDYAQISFEINTKEKLPMTHAIGVDTGINALATCSDGTSYGTNIKDILKILDRKVPGSKAYIRTRRHLRHIIDFVAHQVIAKAPVIVVENLKGITQKTKTSNPNRRLGLTMRRWIGRWNVMYWLGKVQAVSEENRVSFRQVLPYQYIDNLFRLWLYRSGESTIKSGVLVPEMWS